MAQMLPQIEKFLKDSGSGFLVASGNTWVDFQYVSALNMMEKLVPGSVQESADVWAFKERVESIPKIQGLRR